jgi:hypothetical protein
MAYLCGHMWSQGVITHVFIVRAMGRTEMRKIRRIHLLNFSKMAAQNSSAGAEVGRYSINTNKPAISEGGGDTK